MKSLWTASRIMAALAAAATLSYLGAGCRTTGGAASAPDGAGAYATGHYRNLFAENGHAPDDIRRKVDGAFAQLFHGDPATQTIYYADGINANGPLAYITDVKHND